MFFDSVLIEDSADKDIYKIYQYHILKDKIFLISLLTFSI